MPARLSEALQLSKQVMMDSGSLSFYRAVWTEIIFILRRLFFFVLFLALRAVYPGYLDINKLHLMFGSCRMLHKL